MLTITSKYPAFVCNALEQEPNLFEIPEGTIFCLYCLGARIALRHYKQIWFLLEGITNESRTLSRPLSKLPVFIL